MPGFGSSNCGIVITEHLRNPHIVRLIFAEEYEKAIPQDIVDLCYQFRRTYYPNIRFLVDGSNAGFVRQLKVVFGEDPDFTIKTLVQKQWKFYQLISVQNINKCCLTCIL